MSTETLFRSVMDIGEHTGRTLSGLAVPWGKPVLVRDRTGPAYREAFDAGSADVTMRHRANFPVFSNHAYLFGPADPLGVVTFQRSVEGLIFEAVLSKTREADEKLVLVNDGAMRSVSVGFDPLQQSERRGPDGPVLWRTEIRLKELSLAPTGFGQVPEAAVHAVRSEQASTPVLDAYRRRLARLPEIGA